MLLLLLLLLNLEWTKHVEIYEEVKQTINIRLYRWVCTSEVSRIQVWQEQSSTLKSMNVFLPVISVQIRIQSVLEAIEVVNQDTQ